MIRKKTFWISILLTVLFLSLFLIFISTEFNTTKKGNDATPTPSLDSTDTQKNTINIPDYFSDILSKENLINEETTVYSVSYGDENNRETYVFSVPIIEKNNGETQIIKNELCNTDDVFFTQNQNFNISFEKNLINIKNGKENISLYLDNFTSFEKVYNYESIYGSIKESLKYTDANGNNMYCMPTYSGILIEYCVNNDIDSLDFKANLTSYGYVNDQAGYVTVLCKNESKAAVAFSGMVFDENDVFQGTKAARIYQDDNNVYLSYSIPEDISIPYKYIINIDMYQEKMIFDTSTYSKNSSTNFILNNFSHFTANNNRENERTYIKHNLNAIIPVKAALLDKISLNLYAIAVKEEITIEFYNVKENWCSWEITTENHPLYQEKIGEITVDKSGWYEIDITDYIKDLMNSGRNKLASNSIVMITKSGSCGEVLFASADNSFAPPYYKIIYKKQ